MQKKIDEINVLQTEGINLRSVPFERYFGEMSLTTMQKRKRIEFSEKMESVMLFMIALISTYKAYEIENNGEIQMQIESRVNDILLEFGISQDIADRYTNRFVNEVYDSTIRNYEDEYFTSEDRARYIAENEANRVFNNQEYEDALAMGYKKKTWMTMYDRKVRDTHKEVENKTINIEDAFVVGDSLMMFPKDDSFDAEPNEIVNCRCTVKYHS